MRVRVYVAPIVGTGVRRDPFRSKASVLDGLISDPHQTAHVLPMTDLGQPGHSHALSIIYADDHSALEADPDVQDIFQGVIPEDVVTKPDLLTYLRDTPMGDLPADKQEAIGALMDEHGALRVDFDAETPLFKVQQRYTSALLEADENFGTAF